MPKFLSLYDALGIDRPIFAIVPQVLGPGGTRKLSKREGAKQMLDYKTEGFLPAALINFMATLGWNDGSEQEIYTIPEIIEKFSLSRVQKSGAVFDDRRLLWVSGSHMRALPLEDLWQASQPFWQPSSANYDDNYKKHVLGLIQERLKFLAEIPELSEFFFTDLPVDPTLISDHKQLKKVPANELRALLLSAQASLETSDFSVEDLTKRLNDLLETTGQKPAVLFSLVRIATTQAPSSPGLAETLAVLGRERSLQRIAMQLSAWS